MLATSVSDVAASPDDHNAMTGNVTFPECSRSQCTDITVYGDMSLEQDETFTISLQPLPGHNNHIKLIDTLKLVTIEDNDSKSLVYKSMMIVSRTSRRMQCIFGERERSNTVV